MALSGPVASNSWWLSLDLRRRSHDINICSCLFQTSREHANVELPRNWRVGEEKELRFICDYCKEKTTIVVQIEKVLPTQRQEIIRVYYCTHCKQPNKVPVPDNLAVHRFILGRDKGFLGYTDDDVPLIQGEKDEE